MTDMINPNHYRGDRQYEPIAVIEDWGLNYRLGNAVKYISRNGRKPGEDPREGLKKAIWYLEREIEALDRPSQYVPFETSYEDVLRPAGYIRVYELAHDLGLSNREVLEACDSLGISVKSHSSSLCAAAASKLRGFLSNRGVQYEDVLEYYGETQDLKEAWPEDEQPDYATGSVDLILDDLWDPTLGPIEIDPEEVAERLSRKDLDQFEDDEIVSTVERRGMIIGFKKDGSSCVLKNGRCA